METQLLTIRTRIKTAKNEEEVTTLVESYVSTLKGTGRTDLEVESALENLSDLFFQIRESQENTATNRNYEIAKKVIHKIIGAKK